MNIKLVSVAALVAALGLVGCKSAEEHPQQAEVKNEVTAEAKVKSISAATREIVLERDDGVQWSFIAGPEVRNFDQIDVENAWTQARGDGVVVAVIDTGVAFADDSTGRLRQVQDLAGTGFVGGYDFVDDDEAPFDEHGHGDLRIIKRRKSHEPGVIRTMRILRRTGFPGNLHRVPLDGRVVLHDHQPHPLADEGDVFG